MGEGQPGARSPRRLTSAAEGVFRSSCWADCVLSATCVIIGGGPGRRFISRRVRVVQQPSHVGGEPSAAVSLGWGLSVEARRSVAPTTTRASEKIPHCAAFTEGPSPIRDSSVSRTGSFTSTSLHLPPLRAASSRAATLSGAPQRDECPQISFLLVARSSTFCHLAWPSQNTTFAPPLWRLDTPAL